MALISCSVMVYALSLLNKGLIDRSYAEDCCKAAGAGIGFSIGWYIENRFINFQEKNRNILVQILKIIFGVLGAFAIKSGLNYLIGGSIAADIIRYALMVLWVSALYPVIIKKYFTTG